MVKDFDYEIEMIRTLERIISLNSLEWTGGGTLGDRNWMNVVVNGMEQKEVWLIMRYVIFRII